MSSQSYHVFGAAQVWVGTGSGTGAARLLQFLGTSESGVTCRHMRHLEPVKTDVAGPVVPAELQQAGEDAVISCDLAVWSKTILDLILKVGTASTPGVMPVMGELLATNSKAFHLAIVPPSSSAEVAREYYTAVLRDAQEIRLGTKVSVYRCNFYAWPFIPARKASAFDAPFASTADAAVISSSGAVLFVDGTISGGRFDTDTL